MTAPLPALPLPPAAAQLLDHAGRWTREQYPLPVHRAMARETDDTIARRLWSAIADLGWTSVALPPSHGGWGGDRLQACAISQACGASLLALPWLEHAMLATGLLLRLPAGPARDALLSASPQACIAVAAAEDGQRSLLQCPATRASGTADGWRLQGRKAAVAGATFAGTFLVTATLDGAPDAGPAVFAIEAATPGLRVRPSRALGGRRIAQLDVDVQLPPGALLARGAAAADALALAVDDAALAACTEAVGLASMALGATLDHLRTRHQFGQPIGRFQALQHRAADMFVALRYAAALAWATVEDAAADPGADHGAAIACAKAEVMRQCRIVVAGATQLHGGMGVVDELPVSHAARRLLELECSWGDRTARLDQVARALAA